MNTAQQLTIILMCALGTMLTRFLPFLLFPANKPTPRFVRYLGHALPAAVFGMLLVYCLKGVEIASAATGLPELIAILIVVGCTSGAARC